MIRMETGIDKYPVDFPWTLVHIGSGMVAGTMNINPWVYGASIVLYELLENALIEPESDLNALTDIAVGILGYVGAQVIRQS